jgi:hypothetical protein
LKDEKHPFLTICSSFSFAQQLMKVLSRREYAHIISWTPSGKAFMIHRPKQFTHQILPEHFKSAKYSSFTRKLHRWGFMRHYRGDEAGAFFHKDFQKDRMDLVDRMTCKSGTGLPKQSSAAARDQAAQKKSRSQRGLSAEALVAAPSNMELEAILSSYQATLDPTLIRLQALQQSQAPSSNASASDLNAFIELEVARRMQERLDTATMERRFSLFQQGLQQQDAAAADRRFSLIQQGFQQEDAAALGRRLSLIQGLQPQQPSQFAPSPFLAAWNDPGSSMDANSTALALAAQGLYYSKPEQPSLNNYAAILQAANALRRDSFGSLPPINIQGAKSA